MPRYIDSDNIDYTVTKVGMDEYAGYRAVAFESDIDAMPTADVVPRAEVEGLIGKIFEDLEMYMEEHKDYYVILSQGEFIELKNKYTKGGAIG